MEQKNRAGEFGSVPPRSDRLYSLKNFWFFATREGAAMGPFESRVEAEDSLLDFVEFLDLAKPKTKKKFLASMDT